MNLIEKLQTLKVINQDKLAQYIDFCLKNDIQHKIKNETSHHHILPNKLFPEYSNLKDCPWNGTHLTYSDHYYAHWLFTEAIEDYGQLFAFCAMHNKDKALGRINEEDLIQKEEFNEKMLIRNKEVSKQMKGKVIVKDKDGNRFAGNLSDERYLSGELISLSKGRRWKGVNLKRNGIDNANSKKFGVFNEENELIYTSEGNSQELCKEHKLPYVLLNHKKPIKVVKGKYTDFNGWYKKEL